MPLSWIALNAVKGLGPVRINALIEKFGSPEAIFKEPSGSLFKSGILSEHISVQLKDPSLFKYAENQLSLAEKNSVTIITLADKAYPVYLKEIFAPPPLLYAKGNFDIFNKHAVSIVGTRNPTMYGKTATTILTRGLVEQNLVIVSGLARGIDTFAHECALQYVGYTIAVLGSGIDRIYPQNNTALSEKISHSGILLSEFPMGTPPEAFNFPRRNRIISGLSAGVVVIEAGQKSGSLITANYGLQQSREIFAVPGPITSPMSTGTFNLLRQGAIPARNGTEIAENLRLISARNINFISCPQPKLALDLLFDSEKEIFEQISAKPVRIDELCSALGMTAAQLYPILLNLELRGLIVQTSGQMFARKE